MKNKPIFYNPQIINFSCLSFKFQNCLFQIQREKLNLRKLLINEFSKFYFHAESKINSFEIGRKHKKN